MLQLLNTGHSGNVSTVHVNSAAQGISRFTSCVLQSGVEIPYKAIKSNIADSLQVVLQINRRSDQRYVAEVLEVCGFDPETDKYDFDPLDERQAEMSCPLEQEAEHLNTRTRLSRLKSTRIHSHGRCPGC